MNRQQKLKIALPVLIVIMAIVWGPIIFGSKPHDKRKNVTDAGQPSKAKGPSEPVTRIKPPAKSTYTGWGTNPFMPSYDKRSLVVEGIMWDKTNPRAIVNGSIVGPGATVASKQIIEIKPGAVVVRDGDRQIEVGIGEQL